MEHTHVCINTMRPSNERSSVKRPLMTNNSKRIIHSSLTGLPSRRIAARRARIQSKELKGCTKNGSKGKKRWRRSVERLNRRKIKWKSFSCITVNLKFNSPGSLILALNERSCLGTCQMCSHQTTLVRDRWRPTASTSCTHLQKAKTKSRRP